MRILIFTLLIYLVISQYSGSLNTGCTTTLNVDTRNQKLPSLNVVGGTLEKTFAEDGAVSPIVYKASSVYHLSRTEPMPAKWLGRYKMRAFIRRTSIDSIPADKFYIGGCPLDSNKNWINGAGGGTCYYYYISDLDAKTYLPYKQWVYFQFEVGTGTNVNLPAATAYISMGFWLNYKVSPSSSPSATFQINGAEVIERLPDYQLKSSEVSCPANRTFQLSILTGFDQGSQSNALNLKLSFYDSNQNLLAVMPVRWGTCNYFQSGYVDTVKACANWVQKVASMKVNVSLSDELQVESMTVAFGSRIATKSQFWLDDTGQGTIKSGWPVYTNLLFKL